MDIKNLILEAHSWLGTSFKHQGRVKISANDQGGCDCLGFIMGLGLFTKDQKKLQEFDQINYPRLLHSNILQENLDLLLERGDEIVTGTILLIRINNWPQHLALVVDVNPCVIIHSYLQAKKVVKQHLPREWKENIVAIYNT
jgi:hypothetical protein